MKKVLLFLLSLFLLPSLAGAFDLTHWKLQIPGPKEINPIGSYTSKYFYYENGAMVFWVDSSETGATKNSTYVRSELRELINPSNDNVNWPVKGAHTMTADLLAMTTTSQLTVLQIHGITKSGGSAPPLLRVALMNGDLYAWLKGNNSGSKTYKILLQKGIQGRFAVEVKVENYRVKIKVNGVSKMDRSISFWKYYNYFKAGNYPQAHEGISTVRFYSLNVTHQ